MDDRIWREEGTDIYWTMRDIHAWIERSNRFEDALNPIDDGWPDYFKYIDS